MDSQALTQVHNNQIMALEFPTFHHWVGQHLKNNQVHQITAMEFPILHFGAG